MTDYDRQCFDADALCDFAVALLQAGGLEADMASDVAEVLVEGDLLGHDTHGLALLAPYLAEIEKGAMTKAGDPEVVSERASVATWDGLRLPGPHLVRRAIDWARPRALEHGTATVVIRRSHHIACLAAYLEAVARAGLMIELYCSDPAVASVAPFGGTQAVFTPNPMAFGIPTSHDPILVDISASITTNGMSGRLRAAGTAGEHEWWLDALGQPTRDPTVIFAQPPGTILPLGGLDAGHKGYGLALLVEALTGGLAGHGRADIAEGWGATVMLRLADPAAFGGSAEFTWQTDWIADACRRSNPRDAAHPVRLPGERGLARKREQLAGGIALHPSIMPLLKPWSVRHRIALPAPFAP
ncbi:MAG: Ldh family oxidoreductase [Lautropia sp.]